MAFAAFIPAIIGAVGAIAQGQQAKNAADYNAKVDEQNATITRQQANQREEIFRKEARQNLGRQRAALAESGVGMGGSGADIIKDSALNMELDALNIRYQGDLEARGLVEQAKMSRLEGRQRRANAGLQAAGSILGGVSKRYGK
jgi:hypothetical protein